MQPHVCIPVHGLCTLRENSGGRISKKQLSLMFLLPLTNRGAYNGHLLFPWFNSSSVCYCSSSPGRPQFSICGPQRLTVRQLLKCTCRERKTSGLLLLACFWKHYLPDCLWIQYFDSVIKKQAHSRGSQSKENRVYRDDFNVPLLLNCPISRLGVCLWPRCAA